MDAIWIDRAEGLHAVVEQLGRVDRYAFDTEFLRERTYFPQLALLQIAWREDDVTRVALVDPLRVELTPLAEVLRGPGLAVVHAASQDLAIVERACGALPSRLFDPQLAAAFLGYEQPSLSALCDGLLGRHLPKGDQLTDWMRRPLSDEARRYAASDVLHLLDLHRVLTTELAARGRDAWAEEECERVRARTTLDVEPETVWWRLKGKGRMQGRARGVAQSLAAWRERRAMQLDRPTRTVLSDLAILALAGRPVTSADELARTRGVGRLDPRTTRELLEAIEQGLALREPALRLPPKPPRATVSAGAVALALAWVAEVAERHELAPAVLATRDDVIALRRGEGRLADGWRRRLVGDDLEALWRGETLVGLRDGALELVAR